MAAKYNKNKNKNKKTRKQENKKTRKQENKFVKRQITNYVVVTMFYFIYLLFNIGCAHHVYMYIYS